MIKLFKSYQTFWKKERVIWNLKICPKGFILRFTRIFYQYDDNPNNLWKRMRL